MGLACVLGLAACVTIGQGTYSKNDAFDIMYECDLARSYGFYEDYSFILVDGKYRLGRQQGYAILEFLEDKGVDFRWKPKGKVPSQPLLARYRKQQLKLACAPFLAH